MLTVDLVQTFKKGKRLYVRRLNPDTKERAVGIADAYIDIAKSHLNLTKAAFDERCRAVEVHVRDKKTAAGLLKLITDRCDFEMSVDVEPALLREAVFKEASRRRAAAEQGEDFDRSAVLAETGERFDLRPDEIEHLLFADLEDAYRMVSFAPISPEHLVELYEKALGQAVLLRATRVTVSVQSENPASYRRFFRKLKFLGLLHVIHPMEKGGYRIDIDGPFSMFRSVTKYGFKLALLMPALDECEKWSLDATILWGKEKASMEFHLEGGFASEPGPKEAATPLSDDIAVFLERFKALDTEWDVSPSTDILELLGEGLCIPDLRFVHRSTGEKAYLEVMGFWSRDAIWKRVELVEAGLPHRIIFAVSKRLRVSEQVLPDDLPGSLYVYKGVMNAGRIAELLNEKIKHAES